MRRRHISVWQQELDGLMEQLEQEGRRPRLLLHVCCGPCASYVLECLERYFDITLWYSNSNILPEEEYEKRLYWLRKLLEITGRTESVALMTDGYEPEKFLELAAGREQEKEGGERCRACFRMRLEKTAQEALRGGYEYIGTTLTVSRHKNAEVINGIGRELAEMYGVKWLPADFKKRGGSDRSSALAEQYGLYEQTYCGCGMGR